MSMTFKRQEVNDDDRSTSIITPYLALDRFRYLDKFGNSGALNRGGVVKFD